MLKLVNLSPMQCISVPHVLHDQLVVTSTEAIWPMILRLSRRWRCLGRVSATVNSEVNMDTMTFPAIGAVTDEHGELRDRRRLLTKASWTAP
jgi:hypothetical protein